MHIFLSTWLTDISLGNSLTKKRAKNRLVSFYFLQDQNITSEQLREYYQRGRVDCRKNK